MEHYVVINECASHIGGNDCIIHAVCHSIEEAKMVFKKYYKEEKQLAIDEGWEIYEDDGETMFDAGEEGYYANNFTRLYIQGVI